MSTTAEPTNDATCQAFDKGVGLTIGRYKLLEKIGEGGCGSVYVAEQTEPVRRRVALKVIKLGMDTRAVVARFEAERQALALMDHPNIAKVFDAGAADTGRPFFVMELVHGLPITQYCDQEKLTTEQRLRLFIQVCQAIQHAHQKGIIHRDIKPSNILVAVNEGQPVPKVIDFGIAKATQQQLTDKTIYTQLEQFIGTPVYMSPEQADLSALDIDTRSDIYSLGVVLYELLTSQTPFEARDLLGQGLETMRRVIREQEPPRPSTRLSRLAQNDLTTTAQRRKTEPPRLIHQMRGDLDWVAMKCLEKDRTRRYETANALAMEVQRFLRHEPVTARPPSTPYRVRKFVRRNRVMVLASAVVAVTLVLGIVVSTWEAVRARQLQTKAEHAQGEEAKQRRNADQARLNEVQLRKEAQAQAYASDMKAAQVALQQNNLGMAVELIQRHIPKAREDDLRGLEWRYLWQQCRSDELQSFPHGSMVHAAILAPDASYVATAGHDGKVRLWDPASARLLREFEARGHFHDLSKCLAVSPDGKWLAFVGADGLVEVRQTGTWARAQKLQNSKAPLGFSPTSKWLVTGGTQGLQIWNASDWTGKSVTNAWANFNNLAFTPEGNGLVCGYEDFWLVSVDLPSGTATRITHNEVRSFSLAVSPDGKWLASGDQRGEILLWDLAAHKSFSKFRAHSGLVYGLAFSPDGKWLASGGNDQLIDLWVAGTTNKAVTLHGHLDEIYGLSFSANGRQLLSASKDGTAKLWGLQPRRTRTYSIALPENSWALGALSDGAALVTQDPQGFTCLWGLPKGQLLQSNNWTRITDGADWTITFPGSGRVLGLSTNSQVRLWDLQTGGLLQSMQLGATNFAPRFLSRDDRWLLGNLASGGALLYDLRASRPSQAFPDSYSEWDYADFSPDGRWLAHATANYCVRIWDLAANCEKAFLPPHKWNVWALRFSPDSRTLASGSWDGQVRLWSVETGKPVCAPLKGHRSGVAPLVFSADGKTLVTGSDDRTIRWWNVATGREMLLMENAFLMSRWTGSQAEFNPGGNMLIWNESDGSIHVTTLPTLAEIDTEISHK